MSPPAELDALKERVARVRARPGALRGSAEAGDAAHAVVVHEDATGPAWALESVTYVLDGATVYSKVDVDGDLARGSAFEVFAGPIAPGVHELAVQLVYRAVGSGLSRYWDGQRFEVQGTHRFGMAPGLRAEIRVAGYERDVAADGPDRLAVRIASGLAPTP